RDSDRIHVETADNAPRIGGQINPAIGPAARPSEWCAMAHHWERSAPCSDLRRFASAIPSSLPRAARPVTASVTRPILVRQDRLDAAENFHAAVFVPGRTEEDIRQVRPPLRELRLEQRDVRLRLGGRLLVGLRE